MQRVRLHRERLKTRSAPANPTLPERIALALAGNGTPITAEALSSLFDQVADALLDAEVALAQAEAKAFDPTVLDAGTETLQAARHHRDRLAAAVQALRTKHQQVTAQERKVAWNRDADVAEQKRDDLTEEFAQTYPELVSQLIELFQRVRVMDQETERINGEAPNSEGRRLLPVGVRPDLLTLTKLLGLSGQVVWPPPAPPLALQMTMPVVPHPGSHWFEAIQQRDQERHVEAQRVAAYYQNQQEQREQREAAETKARRGNGASP